MNIISIIGSYSTMKKYKLAFMCLDCESNFDMMIETDGEIDIPDLTCLICYSEYIEIRYFGDWSECIAND